MSADFWPRRPIALPYGLINAHGWLSDEGISRVLEVVTIDVGATLTDPVVIDTEEQLRLIGLVYIGGDAIGMGQLLLQIKNERAEGGDVLDNGPHLYLAAVPYPSGFGPSTKGMIKTYTPAQAGKLLDDLVERIELALGLSPTSELR